MSLWHMRDCGIADAHTTRAAGLGMPLESGSRLHSHNRRDRRACLGEVDQFPVQQRLRRRTFGFLVPA